MPVVSSAALISALVVLCTAHSWRTALRVLLDLLTAAGLLRLAGRQGWADLVAVAAIVLVRNALWAALAAGRAPPGRQSPPRCAQDDHRLPWATRGETGKAGG